MKSFFRLALAPKMNIKPLGVIVFLGGGQSSYNDELARFCNVSHTAMQKILKKMLSQKLVTVPNLNEEDGRKKWVKLTRKGEKIYTILNNQFNKSEEKWKS